MLKKIIATALVASALMFSGCGSVDSEGESRLSSQVAIDDGDFSLAIENIEAIPASQRSDSDNLTLASAYMGDAGVSFVDVISLMGTEDPSTGSSGGFETFAKQIDEKKTPDTIAKIDAAIAAYSAISTVSTQSPSRAITVTNSGSGDAALFLGIAYMVKATVVMSYLGDITGLGDVTTGAELQATADVIKCVYAGTGCATMTFTSRADGNVDVNTTSGISRIATPWTDISTRGDLVLTDYVDNTYAVDGNYTLTTALIDTINGGFEAIIGFAPEEIQQDIRDYRTEIGGTDGNISASDIATFLE